jgi:hypothetical protein
MAGSVRNTTLREKLTRPVYNIGLATLLTVLVIPTQPVVSPELSGSAVLGGAVIGGVVAYATDLFTGSLRWTVESRDLLITGGAILLGVLSVLFLSDALIAAVIHGALAYLWTGSILAVLLTKS